MRVLKFGGTSVGGPKEIEQVISLILQAKQEGETAVVISAMSAVTNALISLGEKALKKDETFIEDLHKLEERHIQTASAIIPPLSRSRTLADIKVWMNNLEDLLQGIFLVQELSPKTLDYIMSFGERLSAKIVADALTGLGNSATFIDTRDCIITDSHFGRAKVDFDTTNKNITQLFNKDKTIKVFTGFIASTKSGETTTLGRGGSDYTASIVGAALNAKQIEIWTDVDGVLTADPKKVKKAFPLDRLTYEEAHELANCGAKVIYPPTMVPAQLNGIPIITKNTFNPTSPGTIVSKERSKLAYQVTGVSSLSNVSLLKIQGSGMVGVPGTAAKVFNTAFTNGINVLFISQASSEYSICIAVEPKFGEAAKESLTYAFREELSTNLLEPIEILLNQAVVSIVGEGMSHVPGISAKLFTSLGRNDINVVAIAQGSSERNISVIISNKDESKALNVLHDAFFLSDTKTLRIYQAGAGLIGGTLLKQIESHRQRLMADYKIDVQVCGLVNTKNMIVQEDGIDIRNWEKIIKDAETSPSIDKFVDKIFEINAANAVFVDTTASVEVSKVYTKLLKHRIPVITPNKKAQSAPIQEYNDMQKTAKESNATWLYETSVGAGLPVISTLNDLLKSGDEVIKIEAVLSGTLSYIFNTFKGTRSFSDVVKEAKEKGYTEPDPRDDLCGIDFARKLLILARECGYKIELSDIKIENLVPEKCQGADTPDEFMKLLPANESEIMQRQKDAEKSGKKLCYIGMLQDGVASVKLHEISTDHPFFNLSGSDNIISFTTKRYFDRPLVVKGPGAGAEVTAAGVFADIVRIAR